MHFAAYYGLEQTVWVLLYEGEGLDQCNVRNDVGETPIDIAQAKGYGATIGQTIGDFAEITNAWGMCQFMKELYDQHSDELNLVADEKDGTETEAVAVEPVPELPIVSLEDVDEGIPILSTDPEMEVLYTNLEVAEDEEGDDTVSVRVFGERVTEPTVIKEAQVKRHSLHLTVPHPSIRKPLRAKPEDYVNVHLENQKAVDGPLPVSAMQTYDVPPPPNPVPQALLTTPNGPTPNLNYYDLPRPSLQDYCIPPSSARPVPPKKPTYKPPESPIFTKKTESVITELDGYITVPSVGFGQQEANSVKTPMSSSAESEPLSVTSGTNTNPKYPTIKPTVTGSFDIPVGTRAGVPHLPKQFQLDPTQEELLELMNDFKNNVYNMRELELLYENWRQRNDVQRDFRERQKELKEIQKEYKKIQENIRKQSRKQSSINRLMKLIPGCESS